LQNIPRHLVEGDILPHFERFGQIYEFRLMMDYDNSNRGYAFLKYTCVQDAVKTMEVMNHFIFENGSKLMIRRSYNKCRLYVGKFPKSLTHNLLDHAFRQVFPTLHKFVLHNRTVDDGDENRGFGILEFTNHKDALEAKKICTPSGLELFGTTLDVSWDKHNRCQDDEEFCENRTLFVRNINPKFGSRDLSKLMATRVPYNDVKKISRIRDLAFIDFTNHESAEIIKKFLNNYQLCDKVISTEWAMPPKE
jgi:RNA recognition motif-containing protein